MENKISARNKGEKVPPLIMDESPGRHAVRRIILIVAISILVLSMVYLIFFKNFSLSSSILEITNP